MMRAHDAVEVRVATAADIEMLFDIRTSVRENHQTLEGLAVAGITPDSIAHMLETTSRAWVAVVDETAVAFSMANAEEATVFAMFVRPGYEGRGLGAQLMRAAEDWLFENGCEEIWLLTGADPAIRANGFYRHIGWQPAGMQDDGQMKYVRRKARRERTAVMGGLLLLVTVAAGCASAQPADVAASSAFYCEGRTVLVVRNNTGGDVEIVQTGPASGVRSVVATLGQGHHEVDIQASADYSYTAVRYSDQVTIAGERRSARNISLQRQCRSS